MRRQFVAAVAAVPLGNRPLAGACDRMRAFHVIEVTA